MALRRDEGERRPETPPERQRSVPAGSDPTTVPPWRQPMPHLRRPARFAVRLFLLAFAPFLRLEDFHRLDDLPEPTLFALNHNNSVESVLVPAALIARRRGRIIRFAVDWMFLHLPLVGWLLRQVDPIPVYTKPFRWRLFEGYRQARRHRSPVDGLRRALEAGGSVGLFPEGTRNADAHHLRRGRSGLGHLVLDGPPVPVVPVGIDYPAKERLGRVPRVGRTVVRVGAPLDFSAERRQLAAGGDRRRLTRAVVDRVMVELAALSGKQPPPSAEADPAGRPSPPPAEGPAAGARSAPVPATVTRAPAPPAGATQSVRIPPVPSPSVEAT